MAVLAVGCGAGGGGGTQVTGLAGATTVPTTLPPVTTTVVPPRDKGFVVLSTQLKPDSLGYFGGTADVRNDSQHAYTASMTFTFRQNGKVAGTADALANGVAPGQTVTVQLNSINKWDGGPVTYSFQVTSLY
jgi:hypothetical protein